MRGRIGRRGLRGKADDAGCFEKRSRGEEEPGGVAQGRIVGAQWMDG